MRLIILALCSLIFWNCYTIPYKSRARAYPQSIQEYAPEEKPEYKLALYESVYNKGIGGNISFTDILNESDTSNPTIVLRVDNRSKTSIINIKPKINTEQLIGEYSGYNAYIIFKEIDLASSRIIFRLNFTVKKYTPGYHGWRI